MEDFGYGDELEERAYFTNRIGEWVGSLLIGIVGFYHILRIKDQSEFSRNSLEEDISK